MSIPHKELLILEGNSAFRSHITLKDTKHLLFGDVLMVRDKLADKYDVINPKSPNYKYKGLCDEACIMFVDRIKIFNAANHTNFAVEYIHGEQSHSLKIDPIHWVHEHTWIRISNGAEYVYFDITSSQFDWLHHDIPNYYISSTPPKWYYPDGSNPFFYWWHKNKFIARTIAWYQYKVCANICKFIRKISINK